MKLLAVAGDIDSLIAGIRLVTPLKVLAAEPGWSLVLRSFHDCRRADLLAADVLIVQRADTRRVWRLERSMQRRGGAVVYEIDDLLTDVPPHISNHAGARARVRWLQRCLTAADVVTVSTGRLASELGATDAVVVPNCALPLGDEPLPAADAALPVTLLLASMERLATEFIYPALKALEGPGVQVVVVGPAGAGFAAAGVAVQQVPLMPRAQFVRYARALPNPLAVIPLENSRFAACKSAIKWFEYAEAGVPVVCSNVSPYCEVVEDGVSGRLVPNDAAAWQAALRGAVEDSAWRQRVASRARATVRAHHTLGHSVAAWRWALAEALQRRAAAGRLRLSWAARVGDALADAFDGLLIGLRRLNRRRLMRRHLKRR